MKKVIHRKLNQGIKGLCLIVLLVCSALVSAQAGDPAKGKALFNTNCAACHSLDKKMTGPALRSIEDKVKAEGLDRKWIYDWVHNSAGLIKSGDAYANKIFKEYNSTPMTPFPQLSTEDIDNILAYTAEVKKEAPVAVAAAATGNSQSTSNGISTNILLAGLIILFALLALALYSVNKTLRRFAQAQNIDLGEAKSGKSIWQAFVKNQFLMLVLVIALLLAGAYFLFSYFMQVDVNQGYQPVQPIHFSHKIHAGDNGIDCKYCHSAARTSKTSGIPSVNVCMNCHKTISEYNGDVTAEHNKEFYDGEIKKLHAAAGWDDSQQKYTGNEQPIKWVRIHNLPDFVYFNHSQHVSVAGIECQTCHGPIQEMEVVHQFAPLTMGWCIDCHKTTNVNMKDNAYYEKIHAELSKKYGVEELTEAQMGGLECGKCHY